MWRRRWGLSAPNSAGSIVATPLHGEIAPFRLISPPMRFPPLAVIGGSSPDQGYDAPGPSLGEAACKDIPNKRRLPRWGLRNLDGFWPKKAGKIPGKKLAFSQGIIPWLSPDAKHPGWPPMAAGSEAQGRQVLLSFPMRQREPSCLNASSNIRRRGAREIISLVGCGAKPRWVSPPQIPIYWT